MNSPSKMERKSTLKNEDDRNSNSSSKKANTNSGSSIQSQTKSQTNSKSINSSKEEKRISGMMSVSTIDNTKDRKQSISPVKKLGKSIKKGDKLKKVSFRKKFVDIVYLESYKKYNIDLSYGDPITSNEPTRCRCQIF